MSKKTDKNTTIKVRSAAVGIAVTAIKSAMRRYGLTLCDMRNAVCALIDEAVADKVMQLRGEGKSIRAIAKAIHMDERRVSAIIKVNAKPCCGKVECCKAKPKAKAKKR